MKRRLLTSAFLVWAALGSAAAQAQSTPAQTTSAQAVPAQVATSTLANAFSADRLSFQLEGFGKVAYYADTSGTGRPLVLVTSVNAAASAYEMRPLFLAYRGTRPVYVLEWPGFGSSDRPDIRYTPALMTSALLQLVKVVGVDVDVVALSLGSEFAARAAAQEPRIRSLALLSPTGLSEAKTPAQYAAEPQNSERLYGTLSSPPLSGALYGLLSTPLVIDLFLRRSFEGAPDPGLEAYSVQSTRQPGAVYAPLFFISGLLRAPDGLTEVYSKVTQPMLVLYDRDGYINFNRLPQFLALPNASAVRVAPTKGLPQFEQLAQVTAVLGAFWAGLK